MRVVALGSGSSGNSTLILSDHAKILVDAGLPAKQLERHLLHLCIQPAEIDAIFLSHEHGDHSASAGVLARRYGIPVAANEGTLRAADIGKIVATLVPTGGGIRIGDLHICSFALPHDSAEPVGYCIEQHGTRVCVATDLGYATMELRTQIAAASLVILEANHDRDRLLGGPYSAFLKSRISSTTGHLSNQQAADCLVASASGRPQWVWLAHLSAVNNSPRRASSTVSSALKAASIESMRVSVALRDRPSLVWDSDLCFVQRKLPL